jgi:phosphohistidine phosphatase
MTGRAGSAAGVRPRTLILLRHAKSAWPEGVADQRRPLAGRGQRDAPAAGRWLGAAGYLPGLVLCSTAQRTRETWQLAGAGLMAALAEGRGGTAAGTGKAAAAGRGAEGRGADGRGAAPDLRFEQRVYGASAGELLELIREQPAAVQTLLLVGHEPGMSELSLALAGSGPGLPRLREKFPTAAIAVLSAPGTWSRLRPGEARLLTFVTPRDIRAAAAGQEP